MARLRIEKSWVFPNNVRVSQELLRAFSTTELLGRALYPVLEADNTEQRVLE